VVEAGAIHEAAEQPGTLRQNNNAPKWT
jgi:hypothetical protein